MLDPKGDWIRAALSRFERPLVRYAVTILRDPDRARDVVQDTFLRLCQQDRAVVDGHLAAWLFRVCRNRALDVKRKESRMTELMESDLTNASSGPPPPSEVAEQHENATRLLDLLEDLSSNQREVLRLKFQDDLSYREISEVTSLSVGNVGFLIHIGIKALRDKWDRQGEGPRVNERSFS